MLHLMGLSQMPQMVHFAIWYPDEYPEKLVPVQILNVSGSKSAMTQVLLPSGPELFHQTELVTEGRKVLEASCHIQKVVQSSIGSWALCSSIYNYDQVQE